VILSSELASVAKDLTDVAGGVGEILRKLRMTMVVADLRA
jgi:hypothetical protein